jgi:hypothetical protein
VKVSSEDAQSWGCSFNELIPKKYRGQTQLLDYILVRANGFDIKGLDRILAVYRVQVGNDTVNLSDHYGIEVHIEN